MLIVLQYFLLTQIIVLLFYLWVTELVIVALAHHPRVIIGKAWGAAAILQWGARMSLRLTSKLKMLLGRYLKNYHPWTYHKIRNFLVPKKLGRRR